MLDADMSICVTNIKNVGVSMTKTQIFVTHMLIAQQIQ